MNDGSEESSEVLDCTENECVDFVIDDAFIKRLVDRLASEEDIPGANTTYGRPLQKAMFLFSAEHDLDRLACMLDYALLEKGINKAIGFEINFDGSSLYIVNDHPNKADVEMILNDNRNLMQIYQRISKNYARIASFYRYEEFSKAYAVNPRDAVEKYRDIFDNKYRGTFSIFVSNMGYEPKFVS